MGGAAGAPLTCHLSPHTQKEWLVKPSGGEGTQFPLPLETRPISHCASPASQGYMGKHEAPAVSCQRTEGVADGWNGLKGYL